MSTINNEPNGVVLVNSNNEQLTSPTSEIKLKDQATDRLYTLYVSNNELTMEEV